MSEMKTVVIGLAYLKIPAEQYEEAQVWLKNNPPILSAFQTTFPDAVIWQPGYPGASARSPGG